MKNILLVFSVLFSFSTLAQSSNYWVRMNDFGGLKRERAVAFTVGDYAYVGTGVDTSEVTRKDFWKYDPVTDSWSQVADLPGSARRNAVAFSIGNYGYVGTGITSASSDFGTMLSDFYRYDPVSNSWSGIASYPGGSGNGVYFATGFGVSNKGYVCGGKLGSNFYISQLWEYNPSTNSWTQKPNFPGGVRYQLCSFVVGNSGFVGFGTDNDMYRNDLWEFKPSANEWIERSSLPSSERSGVATFSIGDRGFICMGNNGGLLDDLWEYNPSEDEWAVRDNYSGSSRKWAVGFALNDRGYVGTGKGYSGKKQSMYKYTPVEWVAMEELEQMKLQVFPNPTTDFINIGNEDVFSVDIYTISGKMIMKDIIENQVNVSEFESGTYIVCGKNENGKIVGKENIVIQ